MARLDPKDKQIKALATDVLKFTNWLSNRPFSKQEAFNVLLGKQGNKMLERMADNASNALDELSA